MDILVAFLILSSIFIIILSYAVYNLIRKVENYEDVVQDQVQYLQNISNTITESSQSLLESILSRDGRYDISRNSRFNN